VRQQYTVFSKSPTSANAAAVRRTAGHSSAWNALAAKLPKAPAGFQRAAR